jgi:hypothetical protein
VKHIRTALTQKLGVHFAAEFGLAGGGSWIAGVSQRESVSALEKHESYAKAVRGGRDFRARFVLGC